MNDERRIERLATVALETARAMLDEYELVVPFGIRVFRDSDEVKMNCPAEQNPEADWNQQLEMVVTELRDFTNSEDVFATALVTTLEAGEETGIGLQVETELSAALFVYPYEKRDEQWHVEQEPVQNDPLPFMVFHAAAE